MGAFCAITFRQVNGLPVLIQFRFSADAVFGVIPHIVARLPLCIGSVLALLFLRVLILLALVLLTLTLVLLALLRLRGLVLLTLRLLRVALIGGVLRVGLVHVFSIPDLDGTNTTAPAMGSSSRAGKETPHFIA